MKKFLIALFCLILVLLIAASCGGSGSKEYSQDDVMASYDWGPDHYYNRDTHRVEKNLHGILN